MSKEVRESDIEEQITEFAELRGWWQAKFVSPALRGVADRIFIRRGRHVFIEIKKPGEEPTLQQQKRAREMKSHGADVYWVDSLERAREILR